MMQNYARTEGHKLLRHAWMILDENEKHVNFTIVPADCHLICMTMLYTQEPVTPPCRDA